MRPFIISCFLLALQLYVSPSQADRAPQIIDPDELVSRLRASPNNKVTIEVTRQQMPFCNTNTLCRNTFDVCNFGGGVCHVGIRSRTFNNKHQHHCTVRVSNCKEKPAHPEKSYEQVLEELRETGVSNFFEPDVDNCDRYCKDQFFEDIRAVGNCRRQYFNKICIVEFHLTAKWPEVPEGLSQEEIFQRSLQVGGVKIKTSNQQECVKSCQQYQSMCSGHGARSQCGTEIYAQKFFFCHIQIQCFTSRHNRVDLQTRRRD